MRALEKERKKNLKSSMERKHESVTTGFDQGWQISDISNLSETAMKDAQSRWDHVAKPLHSLGLLEDALVRIAGIQGTSQVNLTKRALVIMCADNGVVEEGVTQTGQDVTAVVTRNFTAGDSCVCLMADRANEDVYPVDIGVADSLEDSHEVHPLSRKKVRSGTRKFVKEPAMTREEVQKALQVGMVLEKELKEQDYHLIALGEMGIGNTTTSSAVACAILGLEPERMTGRGAGLSDEGLIKIQRVIREALAHYAPDPADGIGVLSAVGGLDLAGLAGVCIGVAMYHVPVVLDGVITAAVALAAQTICPGVSNYLLASHVSAEPAGRLILERLGLTAAIDGHLCLGEGTGAMAFMPLLDMALEIYEKMSTFEDIHIEEYKELNEQK